MVYMYMEGFHKCQTLLHYSIYVCHDEVKDKAFELELSWVGECTY